MALQCNAQVLDGFLVFLLAAIRVEVDLDKLAFQDFGVLQEHVQEHFELTLSFLQKLGVKPIKPLLLWELGHAGRVVHLGLDRRLPLLKAAEPIAELKLNVERRHCDGNRKSSMIILHLVLEHLKRVLVLGPFFFHLINSEFNCACWWSGSKAPPSSEPSSSASS